MTAPCGGCPPCCNDCVFGSLPQGTDGKTTLVMGAHEYGCAKGFGDIVTSSAGLLGQMRDGDFHPVTDVGAQFLRETDNPLIEHMTV